MPAVRKRNPLVSYLRRLGACDEAIEWVQSEGHTDLASAWAACQRGDWMLWMLAKQDPQRADLRPIAFVFAQRAMGHAAAALRDAAGKHDSAEHRAALLKHAEELSSLVIDSPESARAASDAASDAAWAAARAASDAAWATASAAAWDAESAWQAEYIRARIACPTMEDKR